MKQIIKLKPFTLLKRDNIIFTKSRIPLELAATSFLRRNVEYVPRNKVN